MLKKNISLFLAILMVFASSTALAKVELEEGKKLTIADAVYIGLENSVILDQVENQIKISQLSQDKANHVSRKLKRGDRDLRDGSKELNQAESAYEAGFVPQDITLPNGTVIKQGTNIDSLPTELQGGIKEGIESSLGTARDQLDRGNLSMLNGLQDAGANISTKLDIASLEALGLDGTRDVLTVMADINLEVTQASFDIYKNNIALLIQKNYYDVLQAKRLIEVREKAMERGKKQYEFAKLGYEEGLKSKDDMLMANTYYNSTKILYEKAVGEYDKALLELRKNMNVGYDVQLDLEDVLVEEIEDVDLEEGLLEGMKKRIEIKKSLGEVVVYNTNLDEVKTLYSPNTFQYKETELQRDKAVIGYEQAKIEVESSVRQSYGDVMNVAKMLEATKGMKEEAEENLEIARLKYEEGFGISNSLLTSLNLEDSSGTILEVLAAEEKLAEVEENIIKIIYNYNLARMKYYNDIGRTIY